MSDGTQAAEWLTRLVSVPSVSPDHAGPRTPNSNEGQFAEALAGWFAQLGAEVVRDEVLPGRWNVYGIWRGRSERWAALDAHMDTVGVEQMPGDPFARRIEHGRVYGRGAVDTKASMAVALSLVERMRQAGQQPEPNLILVGTVDEEQGGAGAEAFARWVRRQPFTLDTLMVAEPTRSTPVHGHKGAARVEFEVLGKATHSAQPHLGQNAITAAAHLILALDQEHQRLQRVTAAALGPATLTVTLIQGGVGLNVVPDACRLSVDRRVVQGEQAVAVTTGLRALAQRASPLPVSTRVIREMDPFYQAPDTPWLRQLAEWSGHAPAVVPYGTNAAAYGGLAREAVIFGPGSIDQAHGAEEWVDITELEKVAEVYRRWWGLA